MPHYDVAILGAGPGGYVAAVRAAQLGLSVAIIEEKYWGGVCLNVGCIPSKALLRNADLAHVFHDQAELFGISGDVHFDFGIAWDRSRKVAETHVKGIHFLMKKNKVTEYEGRGSFVDANTIDVKKADGSGRARHLRQRDHLDRLAACASCRACQLSENVVTYEEQIMTRELPTSIVIVGAGAIGMEFGFFWSTTASRSRSSSSSTARCRTRTPTCRRRSPASTRSTASRSSPRPRSRPSPTHGDHVTVTYTPNSGGETQSIDADKVLMSIGFAPNVEGFGLENTGVKLTDRGAIEIDDYMHTNVPHIYAIGDVTAKLQLAHVAEAQGVVAAETIGKAETMTLGDYRMMPRATFCSPQVASFGLTEQQARDAGYDVKVAKFPFSANGKANGLGEPIGFVKLIADGEHLELLGGHLIGPDVSELLPELTLAQKWDLTALEAARNVHTHPTLSEAVQEAFHGLAGHMINL